MTNKAKRDSNFSFQFYGTVVRDYFGKQMAQVSTYFLKIEMLEAMMAGIVKEEHNQHDSAFDIVKSR